MYVCMYVCMYVLLSSHEYSLYVHTHKCTLYAHADVSTYVFMFVYLCGYKYLKNECMNVHTHIHTYIHTSVCRKNKIKTNYPNHQIIAERSIPTLPLM